MKIVRLTSENIKRLRAVEITPKGDVIQITGKNEVGKSSILDSIFWAMSSARDIQAVPIRKGEKKARIKLDLGEIVVTRNFTDKGSTLIVESADGARFPSPQKMMESLIGALAFDPEAFGSMKPGDQFDTLKGLVKLDIDPVHLDRLNATDYAKRTEINRDAATARAQAAGILLGAEPGQPVDTAALVDEMQRAGETNAQIETRKTRRAEVAGQITEKRVTASNAHGEALRLRRMADEAEAEGARLNDDANTLQQRLDEAPPLPDPIDTTAIRTQIAQAEQRNRAVDDYARKKAAKTAAEAKVTDLEAQSKALTEAMDGRTAAKQQAIAAAKMPVEGLGFGDGIVTYNDVPFEQASTSVKIRVSMAIAMAANPKLRVVLIRNGSMLDEDNLALVAQMAKENNYQVWVESVDSTGKVGVVIEDGMVKADNQVADEAPAQKDLLA